MKDIRKKTRSWTLKKAGEKENDGPQGASWAEPWAQCRVVVGTPQWLPSASCLWRSNLYLANPPTENNYKNWIRNKVRGAAKAAVTWRARGKENVMKWVLYLCFLHEGHFRICHCRTKSQERKQWPRAYSSFTRLRQIEKQKCKLQAARNWGAGIQEKKRTTDKWDRHFACNFSSGHWPNSQMDICGEGLGSQVNTDSLL